LAALWSEKILFVLFILSKDFSALLRYLRFLLFNLVPANFELPFTRIVSWCELINGSVAVELPRAKNAKQAPSDVEQFLPPARC
jgi:hypothetical protein